jgi:hypothetical protein
MLVVVFLMDLWKIIGTAVSLGTGGPTNFQQALMFPPANMLHKNFVEGRYGFASKFGRITKKNLQHCFSKPCLLTKCNGENKIEI